MEQNPTAADHDTVRSLFTAARIPAAATEVSAAAAALPGLQTGVDALYAIPAARYAQPALRFRADVAAEWAHAADLLRAHGDDVDARVTVGLYRWAYCIFSSRSFRPSLVVPEDQAAALLPAGVSMDDFSVLLPLFDIGNHDMTAEVRWELSGVADAADTAAGDAAADDGMRRDGRSARCVWYTSVGDAYLQGEGLPGEPV